MKIYYNSLSICGGGRKVDLFTFRKMEEDHFTNALMFILSSFSYSLLNPFLNKILGQRSQEFDYRNISVELFSKAGSLEPKTHEYIVGIAPYESRGGPDILESNLDSIPDAWVHGENFTLLFEFKVRGKLDEAQLTAHEMKLPNCKEIIRITWDEVIEALEYLQTKGNEVQCFLLKELVTSLPKLKSPRRSSGMPKEIIAGQNMKDSLHFIITGSKETDGYTVDIVHANGDTKRINNSLSGIQSARRWIANYIYENQYDLPIKEVGEETIITDYCVKPGRKKNAWNQWRLGSYLQNRKKGI